MPMHRVDSTFASQATDLIDRLMNPAAFDHPVSSIERIDTHISWVILTDAYAYKIKKPLVLDFLDFGSLERRHHFCLEELRLNRPWASDIYIDVVAITDDGGHARFGGAGMPVEYAVRMRRFDTDMRLDRQLALGQLTTGDMHDLGQAVATRHLEAPILNAESRRHVLKMTSQQMLDNFSTLEGQVNVETLSSLSEWTEREIEPASAFIAERFDGGFFRDCHGDLHLANLVRMPGGIRTFDCIEFNEDLRNTDVVCDIAFLVMDLVTKGRRDLGAHFLNCYLEMTGDYDGVALLDIYFVYRCLVRAKVAVLCGLQCKLQNERLRNIADADRYCRIALRQTWKPAPMLILMRGLSGSGKTWVSGQLMAALPAIRLRSDVERKRLFGLAETAQTGSDMNSGIYDASTTRSVYQHLVTTAQTILDARHNVILDATFLQSEERDLAFEMGDRCGYTAIIIDVRAPLALMQERLQRRQDKGGDASEAGLDVLDHQRSAVQALSHAELKRTIVYENRDQLDVDALADAVRRRGNSSTQPVIAANS